MKPFKKLGMFTLLVAMAFSMEGISVANASSPSANSSKTAEDKFAPEKSDITTDLASMKFHRQQINQLEKQCNRSAKDDNKMALAMNKKALAKSKADLSRDKAYLRADKSDLKRDHRIAISEQRKAVNNERKNLNAAHKKLNTDLAKGSDAADKDATAEVAHQRMLRDRQASLSKAKETRHSYILAVNRQIKNADAQPGVELYAENTVANTKNWIDK